jgi:branched-chain amino acid transport system ATP-binding protein
MTLIVSAEGLNKRFGAVTAAQDISVGIEQDSVVGLIGTNGAGKTTFINMVTGYLKPDSGRILFDGEDITQLSPREVTRRGISRSFQIAQLYNTLTVMENIMVALSVVLDNAGRSGFFAFADPIVPGFDQRPQEVANMLLERFQLQAYRDRPAQILPGGVRKLLDIALTLVAKPKVLFLDEPTSGVSAQEKFGMMDMVMGNIRSQGGTVLFVEHDMEVISRFSDRVLAFYDGRIIADGPPEQTLSDPDVLKYVVGGHHAKG